jgi:hypothetical protein
MHYSLFNFTSALNSVLFWKMLAFGFLVHISEVFLCSTYALQIIIVFLLDLHQLLMLFFKVFGTKTASLNRIPLWFFLIIKTLIVFNMNICIHVRMYICFIAA